MVIGLTGGIGSGKSTARAVFVAQGYSSVDTDAIVHSLLDSDEATIQEVVEAFGEGVWKPEGGVDRKALGSIVFSDAEALGLLEAILHPRVREFWETEIARDPDGDWVVEIPLLFEKNLQNRVDFTVCVFTDLSTQVERLERKGIGRAQALARIDRQMPLAEKAERADCVLLNEGSLEFLEDQVKTLLARL